MDIDDGSHFPSIGDQNMKANVDCKDASGTSRNRRSAASFIDSFQRTGVYGDVQEAELHNERPQNVLITKEVQTRSTENEDLAEHQKMHHQVRKLPSDGLLGERHDDFLPGASMRVRYECLRLTLSLGCPLTQVVPEYSVDLENYSFLWECFKTYADEHNKQLPRRTPPAVWKAAGVGFSNVSLKASMSVNRSNTGPLLVLELQPLAAEQSCRFQRKFGGDRFLYLSVPSLHRKGLPRHPREQSSYLEKMYAKWLTTEKHMFGRSWRVILIENRKKNTRLRLRDVDPKASQQLVLFATHGLGLRQRNLLGAKEPCADFQGVEVTIEDFLAWFMPFKKNENQLFCKAYARLELGFSKTIPTVTFKPSQIKIAEDIMADGTPESEHFNDSGLVWENLHDRERPKVMNDGCSRISVGAAKLIWSKLNKSGLIPSAFQGRIGGSKGVWMISAPSDTQDPFDNDTWIELTPSQIKFLPHDEDLSDSTYDPHRLTFEVLKSSGPSSTSTFHVAFLPILQERGISRKALRDIVIERLGLERLVLKEAITDTLRLRRWIHDKHSLLEDIHRDEDVLWQAGLPRSLSEKVILLLESGFNPSCCTYLRDALLRLVEKYLFRTKQTLSFPISRSTYVLAVADPIKILQPGEVHLAFSANFQDDTSGESYFYIDDVNVLVARHPALRPSDIQKVYAVYKPELSHLKDVIVFPSTGCYPLAGKLQGGDYDGDTALGITVDNTTLGEKVAGPGGMKDFLQRSFEFRCRPDLLGVCTLFHEKLAYTENSIRTPEVTRVADLHDYLVDCSKNGYIFADEDWTKFINETFGTSGMKLVEPAYKSAMLSRLENAGRSPTKKRISPSKAEVSPVKYQAPKAKYNPEHITDYLVFEVIEPHNTDTLALVRSLLDTDEEDEPDLPALYLRELQYGLEKDSTITSVIKQLTNNIIGVWEFWFKNIAPKADFDADSYNKILERCFEMYCAITPSADEMLHQKVRTWVEATVGNAPSYWALLKASCLYVKFSGRPTFTFALAGKELAYIKACHTKDARLMSGPFWAMMKPKRPKTLESEDNGIAGVGPGDDATLEVDVEDDFME